MFTLIQKFFQAMHKMNLTVRGMYGEGSQAMGDFYQVSNQTTLGRSEEEIISTIRTVVPMCGCAYSYRVSSRAGVAAYARPHRSDVRNAECGMRNAEGMRNGLALRIAISPP